MIAMYATRVWAIQGMISGFTSGCECCQCASLRLAESKVFLLFAFAISCWAFAKQYRSYAFLFLLWFDQHLVHKHELAL